MNNDQIDQRRKELESKVRKLLQELNNPRIDEELIGMIVSRVLLVDRLTVMLNDFNLDMGLRSTQVIASIVVDMITTPLYWTEETQE